MNTAAVTVHNPTAHLGFLSTAIATFEGIERLASMMAKCGTMPAHLVGKPADCFRIVVQAAKWGMDPFAVAECTSLVHGRMCYEGKLVAAVLSSMGAIEGRLDYDIAGKGQQASITVTGTPRGSKKPCAITGSVADWRTVTKKDGQRIDNAWDKMPETMLVYRGTRQWARLYAPEAILGVFTPDERDDEPRDVSASVVVHEGLPATTIATPADARTGPAPTTQQPPAAVESNADTTQSAPSASPGAGDAAAPRDAPKPPAHPSIAAGKDLMRNLGAAGTVILRRLVKLHGGEAKATEIPADRLDAFGLDITTLANLLKQTPVDMNRLEDLLGGWERDAAAQKAGGK